MQQTTISIGWLPNNWRVYQLQWYKLNEIRVVSLKKKDFIDR
jgi:hypothetical protein